MINDKETIVNNHKGESIKITGLNQGNIKSLILLSNKIEGLEDKINYQAENIIRIKEIRRKAKNIIAKNILAGSAFGIATLISIIISTLVFTAVATSVGANFVLANALVENIKYRSVIFQKKIYLVLEYKLRRNKN